MSSMTLLITAWKVMIISLRVLGNLDRGGRVYNRVSAP
ncbi:hypothetical protein [Azospirillum argentinense]